MRGSEFVALRVQLEEELKIWALATHTVERLRAHGIYESPRVGPATEYFTLKFLGDRCLPPRAGTLLLLESCC